MSKYIQNIQDKSIYKLYEDKGYYLKITPHTGAEDRRYPIDVVNDWLSRHIAYEINCVDAKNRNNKQWMEYEDSWSHDGHNYKSGKETVMNVSNPHYEFGDWKYGICYYQGHLKWYRICDYPIAYLYDFKSIEERPCENRFYSDIRKIHPVYKEEYDYKNKRNVWKLI